ncbi:Homocysteine S-methyltransferase 1 [Dinochytrium kinnereticum]|nr:Homocysteine S-methyltransferase 1 [Dinochytrium kinnereticum]
MSVGLFALAKKTGKVLVLDGGLASELETDGKDLTGELWSARMIFEDPDAIKAVHLKYLEAGSDIIITSSYQASIPGLEKLGLSYEKIIEVFDRSTEIARDAIKEYELRRGKKAEGGPYIAASMGSYGAYLANGAEYTGKFNVSDEELINFHVKRLEILARGKPDVFAFETIPSHQETRCIAEAIRRFQTSSQKSIEVWVTLSCSTGKTTGSGEDVETCVKDFIDLDAVTAVGVNCSDPRLVTDIVGRIKEALEGSDKALICYVSVRFAFKLMLVVLTQSDALQPNSGEVWDGIAKMWRCGEEQLGTVESYLGWVKEWVEAGVTGIGGCCRTGPPHIKGIHRLVSHLQKQ